MPDSPTLLPCAEVIMRIVVWQCYHDVNAMNGIDDNRYDYLCRKRYVVHAEHEQFIRPETLANMREYEVIEFYSRERIRELSQQGLINQELKQRIEELLRLRQEHPEGSNQLGPRRRCDLGLRSDSAARFCGLIIAYLIPGWLDPS